jgi:hypothetical protein
MTELQADRDSDRRIAERLGLSVKYRGTMQHPIPFIDDGNAFGPELPRYTTDLNAAVALITHFYSVETGHVTVAFFGPEQVECSILYGDSYKLCLGHGDTESLAVCRAWWAWMDGREE